MSSTGLHLRLPPRNFLRPDVDMQGTGSRLLPASCTLLNPTLHKSTVHNDTLENCTLELLPAGSIAGTYCSS